MACEKKATPIGLIDLCANMQLVGCMKTKNLLHAEPWSDVCAVWPSAATETRVCRHAIECSIEPHCRQLWDFKGFLSLTQFPNKEALQSLSLASLW